MGHPERSNRGRRCHQRHCSTYEDDLARNALCIRQVRAFGNIDTSNLVRQALQRTSEVFPDFTPDFLLPLCGPSVDHPMFTAPMPGAQGVLLLRRLLLQANKDASVLSIGVHSPKVTLLSWARQIGASEEARMAGPSSPVRRSVQCGLVRPRRCAPSNTVTVPDYSVHSIRFPASDSPPTRWS